MKRSTPKSLSSSWLLFPVDLIGLAIVAPLIELLRFLPDRAANRVARGIVSLITVCMPRMRPVGMRNLEIAFPEKSDDERRMIFDRSLDVLARNIVTFAKLPLLNPERAQQMMDYSEGHEIIRSIRQDTPKTGFIIASLHYGCFEQLAQLHAVSAHPASLLVRGFGLPMLDWFWDRRRTRLGNTVFNRKGGYQEVIRHLRRGHDVAMLFDQNVKRNHAVFVDFFGVPVATTKALAYAAIRTGAQIVFNTTVEIAPGKWKLIAERLPDYTRGEESADEKILLIMNDLHRRTERVIREHPEQWFWIHRRFKTRPEGEPETMYD